MLIIHSLLKTKSRKKLYNENGYCEYAIDNNPTGIKKNVSSRPPMGVDEYRGIPHTTGQAAAATNNIMCFLRET